MFIIKLKEKTIGISHDIVVIFVMLVFAAAYFIQTKDLSFQSLLFPRMLFAGIAVTGLLSIRGCIKTGDAAKPSETGRDESEPRGISRKLMVFVTAVFALIFLLPYLGANISIVLFVFMGMLALGVRNKLVLVLTPVGTALFIFFIFKLWLAVPLPVCFLGF